MAFTGRIDWTTAGDGTEGLTPNTFFITGDDGNHYCGLLQNSSNSVLRVGCIETNTLIGQLSLAQWRTDVLSTLTGTSGTYQVKVVLPVRGTAYFGVIGGGSISAANEGHIVCVFYKINAVGALELDATKGFAYQAAANTTYGLNDSGNTGRCYDALLVGNNLYFTLTVRDAPGTIPRPLIEVFAWGVYNTVTVDLSVGSWTSHCTELPYSTSFFCGASGGGRQYGNRACLFDRGAGVIGLLNYHDKALSGSADPTMWYTEIDTVAQTTSGANDISAAFGVPFSDVRKLFSGAASGSVSDDYTTPCISVVSAGLEVIWSRTFTDNIGCLRLRRFLFNADTVTAQSFDVNDVTGFTILSINTMLEGGCTRRNGDSVFLTLRDRRYYYFNEVSIPIESLPSSSNFAYYIERMDDRIWPTIEQAWCLDAALALPQPAPDATLIASSATGSRSITEYSIINGGSGYTAPIGQITDLAGTGTGASVSLSVSSGVIVTAVATSVGSRYRLPQLTVLDTTGVGGVVQPIVTNYATFVASTGSFTASDVGSIIRMGGGKIEIVEYFSSTSITGNIIAPITKTMPNDPNNTPVPAASGQWTMVAPTTTVSGLDHLEGYTVAALADGGVVNDLTVQNGSITLPVEATQIVVGLPFVAQLQTMYMDLGGGPTVQTRRKDVTQVVVRVENSRAPEVGLNQPDAAAQPNQAEIVWGVQIPGSSEAITGMTQIRFRTPSMPAGQPQPLFSGDLDLTSVFSTWDAKGQIAVQQRDPVPLNVTGLVSYVKVGDSTGQG